VIDFDRKASNFRALRPEDALADFWKPLACRHAAYSPRTGHIPNDDDHDGNNISSSSSSSSNNEDDDNDDNNNSFNFLGG
jgi:hypothetical protein